MLKKALFLCFMVTGVAPAAEAADAGRVKAVQGELRINGVKAVKGATVTEGDRLVTAPGASADVVMQSGVRFRIYEKSELLIPPESRRNPLQIIGRLLSIVKKGRPYGVAGHTAVAGVRGTTFYVESQPNRRTYICACEGTLHLQSADGAEHGELEAKHHKAVALDGRGKSEEPMLGHTDQDIEELASR